MRRAANRQTDGEGEKSVGESREGGREEWAIIEFFCPIPSLCAVSAQRRKREGGDKKSLDVVVVGTTKLSRGGKGEKEEEEGGNGKKCFSSSFSFFFLLSSLKEEEEEMTREKKSLRQKRQFALPHLRTRERELLFIPFMRERCWRLNRKSWISSRPFPSTFLLFFTLVYSKLQWAKKKGELHPWTLEIFLSSSSFSGMCAS